MSLSHQEELLERLQSREATVGVIGLGYVGLPLAVTAACSGYRVIGFDIDATKPDRLNANQSYIEAVGKEALEEANESRQVLWTSDFSNIASCDAILICVPTPLTKHREPDLSYVESSTRIVSEHMSPGTIVVLESTTYPGTTEEIVIPILMQGNLEIEKEFWVAFSPEREDPGNVRFHTKSIPKIVGANTPASRDLVVALYSRIVEEVILVSSTSTAEAVKITENIFRAVNIALVNELKVIFSAMDIDIWEVIDGAATKPFGFMPFYPGPGLGGHCIPIDPFYLTWKAREFELSTRFVELAGEINVGMPKYVIARLREALDSRVQKALSSSSILLVGIAYKKNVPDMRESPSVRLMELMIEAGAEVDFLDPLVPEIPLMRNYPQLAGRKSCQPSKIEGRGYDAVVIATDHDAIDYAQLLGLGAVIIDTRNAIARRGLPMETVIKA